MWSITKVNRDRGRAQSLIARPLSSSARHLLAISAVPLRTTAATRLPLSPSPTKDQGEFWMWLFHAVLRLTVHKFVDKMKIWRQGTASIAIAATMTSYFLSYDF
jgi:hypothetical protein